MAQPPVPLATGVPLKMTYLAVAPKVHVNVGNPVRRAIRATPLVSVGSAHPTVTDGVAIPAPTQEADTSPTSAASCADESRAVAPRAKCSRRSPSAPAGCAPTPPVPAMA